MAASAGPSVRALIAKNSASVMVAGIAEKAGFGAGMSPSSQPVAVTSFGQVMAGAVVSLIFII